MKIGLFTDSFPQMSLSQVLDWIVARGIEAVEIGAGGFSHAAHCDLDRLLADGDALKTFRGEIESRDLMLSALNCNANLLDADDGRRQKVQDQLNKTIQLAQKLDLDTVVTMSGCPGGPDGGSYPNWVGHPWQAEFGELLEWQWEKVATPYWQKLAAFAANHGVKLAIEMHPGQLVYNTAGLLRLRQIAGSNVGANLDPSHLFYQGIDPLLVIRTLGSDFVFHVHAKDARIDPHEMALNGVIDLRPMEQVTQRAWSYRTLGFGHGEVWWRQFVSALRAVWYDGALSIEHEDPLMSAGEGIEKSVDLLKPVVLRTMPEETPPWM